MSREIDDGGPAFPGQVGAYGRGNDVPVATAEGVTEYVQVSQGITVRDYFAGKALAGCCANPLWDHAKWHHIAESAYAAADAMLVARKAGDA